MYLQAALRWKCPCLLCCWLSTISFCILPSLPCRIWYYVAGNQCYERHEELTLTSAPSDDVDTILGDFTTKVRQLPCSEQSERHHSNPGKTAASVTPKDCIATLTRLLTSLMCSKVKSAYLGAWLRGFYILLWHAGVLEGRSKWPWSTFSATITL